MKTEVFFQIQPQTDSNRNEKIIRQKLLPQRKYLNLKFEKKILQKGAFKI